MAKTKVKQRESLPRDKRTRLFHCAAGDIVELKCGSILLVTAWANNGILARSIKGFIVDGSKRIEISEGELEPYDDQPIELRPDLMEKRMASMARARI